MKVYHGSDVQIEKIDLLKSREYTDFGRGFYVTNIRGHAHRRAVNIAVENNTQPIVTQFEYIEAYQINAELSVKSFATPSEEWVNFVMMNRDVSIIQPAHSYDIVEGPVANDWVTWQIKRYQKGRITIKQLIAELQYREQTHQICFCTLQSLLSLEIIDDDQRFDNEDLYSMLISSLMNDYKFSEREATHRLYRSAVFARLSDKDTKMYEKAWQDIYKMLQTELKKKL